MWLPDSSLDHLREIAEQPDFSQTKYRLLSTLGRGGMGSVYRAQDQELGREVALKVISDPDPGPEAAERLRREARILARLEHPGIVPVHDVGTLGDGRLYYAMKRVRGRRLDEHLKDHSPPLPQRLRIFERICEAVAFAHAHGVIHRDLKPANIMVGAFGEVLVMDWGVAKIRRRLPAGEPAEAPPDGEGGDGVRGDGTPGEGAAETAVPLEGAGPETAHGTILGTPGYMAPEQARGEVGAIDERTDVFALGSLLGFLLSSAGEAPVPLRAVIEKARAAEPSERYAGATELAAEIGRYLAGLAVGAYRETLLQRLGRFYRRYRAAILLVLAYLLMRVLVFWLFGY